MRPPTPTHPDHSAAPWLRPTRLQVERFPRVCTEGESNWMLRRAPLPANAASPVRFCRSGMLVPIRNVGNPVPRKSLPDHSWGGCLSIQRRCGDVADKINQRADDLPPAANDPPTSVFAGTYLTLSCNGISGSASACRRQHAQNLALLFAVRLTTTSVLRLLPCSVSSAIQSARFARL
jgi:hypothetical protein